MFPIRWVLQQGSLTAAISENLILEIVPESYDQDYSRIKDVFEK